MVFWKGILFYLQTIPCKLLYLLFGLLRIFGTLMAWNRRQSHDCSELFWFSSMGSQKRTRDTAHFHVIGNGGDRFCVSNACTLHRVLFWRVNRYISTYTYYMLFERQGWEKSTSKNVAKTYLDIQITANHCTMYYANN
jgi:hypothetical protein